MREFPIETTGVDQEKKRKRVSKKKFLGRKGLMRKCVVVFVNTVCVYYINVEARNDERKGIAPLLITKRTRSYSFIFTKY